MVREAFMQVSEAFTAFGEVLKIADDASSYL